MRQIANYIVEDEPLAKGGMGQIFKGRDPQGHTVAIKEILPEFATDFSIIARIDKEVKFLMSIDHPSIVNLYSAFRDPDTQCYYIVMEFVEGLNVQQYVNRNGPIPHEEAQAMMMKILDAMECVHRQSIVHRDLKPSNIMILPDKTVRLLDFGVAKDLTKQGLTDPGSIIGTTGYMSPEQAAGNTVNWLSDIYSLGCVFYFMLTGHHAFNTLESEFETKDAIINEKFPRLDKYVKHIPKKYQEVLDKATARNMMERYLSCEEFSKALEGERGTVHPPRKAVSLGRSQCDIIFGDPQCRISRHHADIELVENTGSRYYVLTDLSSNGTYVGNELVHHRSVNIPFANPPEVRLAGEEAGLVDWEAVRRVLAKKAEEGDDGGTGPGDGPKDRPDLPGGNGQPGENSLPPNNLPEDAGEEGPLTLAAAWVFVALGGLLGVVLGMHLATAKTRWYTGQKIHKYTKQYRRLGWAAVIASPVSMLIWILCV